MKSRIPSQALLLLLVAVAGADGQTTLPRISQIPKRLPDPPRAKFVTDRATIIASVRKANDAIDAYNGHCAGAARSTPGCLDEQAAIVKETERLKTSIDAFNSALTDAMVSGLTSFLRQNEEYRRRRPDTGGAPGRPIEPGDVPSVERGRDAVFIGGTGWVYGYVRRNNANLEAAVRADFRAAQKLADVKAFMNVDDYDMVMGLGSAQDFVIDLADRVIGYPFSRSDQTSLGAFTAETQPLYASLKGLRTSKLDCHSNGAMICLRALTMGDIRPANDASGKPRLDVRLFGAQITRNALDDWRALMNGTVTSLTVVVNVGDPIPPASLAAGEERWAEAVVRLARVVAPVVNGQLKLDLSQFDFFTRAAADNVKSVVEQRVPNARVVVGDDPACRARLLTTGNIAACHDMRVYQATSR